MTEWRGFPFAVNEDDAPPPSQSVKKKKRKRALDPTAVAVAVAGAEEEERPTGERISPTKERQLESNNCASAPCQGAPLDCARTPASTTFQGASLDDSSGDPTAGAVLDGITSGQLAVTPRWLNSALVERLFSPIPLILF